MQHGHELHVLQGHSMPGLVIHSGRLTWGFNIVNELLVTLLRLAKKHTVCGNVHSQMISSSHLS
jgi:hypothetical protein